MSVFRLEKPISRSEIIERLLWAFDNKGHWHEASFFVRGANESSAILSLVQRTVDGRIDSADGVFIPFFRDTYQKV